MQATKGAQKITQGRACAFTGVTVHFTTAIAIIVARPFTLRMTNGAMVGMNLMVGTPLITGQQGGVLGHTLVEQGMTGRPIGMITDPRPLFAGGAGADTDDGRAIIGIGAMPAALVGAPAGGSSGRRWGVLFFPRILVEFIDLEFLPTHRLYRCTFVQIAL